jgi:hypothetical protein
MATGTKDDPWELTTAPGTSQYTKYCDEEADPPALVCHVGSTMLRYHLRAVEDLHAWLEELGLAELTHTPRNNRVRAASTGGPS